MNEKRSKLIEQANREWQKVLAETSSWEEIIDDFRSDVAGGSIVGVTSVGSWGVRIELADGRDINILANGMIGIRKHDMNIDDEEASALVLSGPMPD